MMYKIDENKIKLNTIDKIEDSLVSYYIDNYLISENNNVLNSVILREFDCWQGRSDITLAEICGDYSITNVQMEMLSNLTNANIVALLHYKSPRTYLFIKKRLAYADATINRSLRSLLTSNIIKQTTSGSYILNSTFILPKVELVSYEVKLQNWRRALYQAIQYLGFSHYSWVIMPQKHINAAIKNIKYFKLNGIGLISIDSNGKQKIQIGPKKNQPRKKSFFLVGVAKVMKQYLNTV